MASIYHDELRGSHSKYFQLTFVVTPNRFVNEPHVLWRFSSEFLLARVSLKWTHFGLDELGNKIKAHCKLLSIV